MTGPREGVMEHDKEAAARSECYCETCTDRAAWYDMDRG